MPTPIGAIYDDNTQTAEIRYDDGTSETISPVTQNQFIANVLNVKGGANNAANQTTVGTNLTNRVKPGKTVTGKKWK